MGRELRHERFLYGVHSGEDRVRRAGFTVNGADSHAGAAGGGTAVPLFATAAIAACKRVYVAGIALEGIFLRGGGGAVYGGRAHRICGALLRGGATFRGVGAAGDQLSGFGEHAVSLACGSGDWFARLDERRVHVSIVCDSLFSAIDR